MTERAAPSITVGVAPPPRRHADYGSFAAFLGRRLLQMVPVLIAIVLVNFFLIHAAPGDPVTAIIGGMETTPEYIAQVRRDYGLDQPLLVQLGTYAVKVVQLDLGYSFRFREPVLGLILSRMPATFLLMGTALLFSSLIGVLLGVVAARRPFGLGDNLATVLALAGYSMPVFWLGQLMLLVFALDLGVLPVQGMVSMRAPGGGWGRVLDIAHHLILPATTYGIYHLTLVYRLTRVKMMDTLRQDYITTARAKGVDEAAVLMRHALPNALSPVITVIGYNLGFMLAGSVFVETVFGWPGMGRLMFDAVTARDFPLLLGLFIIVSLFVVVGNIATDLVHALLDPRAVIR
jgi:ABC-type dipeptide/oligopeptide/nickel transport system permease component